MCLMRSIWKEKSNSTFDHELSMVKLGFCLAVLHAWQLDANPSTSSNLLDFKCVGCTPFVHFNEVIYLLKKNGKDYPGILQEK